MNFTIRRLQLPPDGDDDVEALTALLHRAYAPLAAQGLRYVATWQGSDITLNRIRGNECYVGLLGGRLVATINLIPPDRGDETPWYARPEVAHFGQFAVDPDAQGLGLGARLMDFVEDRARELGASELALDTSERAERLIATYARRGYRLVERADWEETNYASVVMSKRL